LTKRGWAKLVGLGVAASWGVSFISIGRVADDLSAGAASRYDVAMPFFLARFAVTAVCFVPVLILGRREIARYDRRAWAWVVFLGLLLGPGYHLPLYFAAPPAMPSALMSLIVAMAPVITVVLARAFLAEPAGLRRVGGILLSFCGVAVAVAVQKGLRAGIIGFGGSGAGWLVYPALVGCSALAGALWAVCGKVALKGRDPLTFVAAATVAATVLTAFLWSPAAVRQVGALSGWGWAALLYLAVVGTFLAYLGWYWSLGHLDASELTVFLNVTPLVALCLGALVRHESMRPMYLAGAAMIVVGVYLAQTSGARERPVPEEKETVPEPAA